MNKPAHIVFYDDLCPLCNSEIEHYKKITPVHSISWLGINASQIEIEQHGLNKQELLKRIHAIDSRGNIVTGAAAFALIWRSLKYYRVLGFLVTKLRLIPLLDFFYGYFAKWRYNKNKVCDI